MKKIVKKYGDSYVITFAKQEREIYNIKLGSIIDLGDIVVLKGKPLPQHLKRKLKGVKK